MTMQLREVTIASKKTKIESKTLYIYIYLVSTKSVDSNFRVF